MSNFGVTQRPSLISKSTPTMESPHPDGPKVKSPNNLSLEFPFNLPATPEAAAGRIIRNLCHFSMFYMLVLWVGLSISLLPERRDSLFLLILLTIIGNQYVMMLQLMPKAICVNKGFDKMLVLLLMAVVTTVALVLTEAAIHLIATLGIGIPVILIHAVFWRDGMFVNEEAPASHPAEAAPLVDNASSV